MPSTRLPISFTGGNCYRHSMLSRIAAASAALVAVALLSGCTSNPVAPQPEPTASAGSSAPATAGGRLPTCAEVTDAIGSLVGSLAFNATTSEAQTAPEDYAQRVCVYETEDSVTQLGVTIAAIPFQQAEIDSYATLPNAIADDRLAQYGAVIQTLGPDDAADGTLDSALYLFDTTYSITIQGVSTGDPIAVSLPQLTVSAAIDGAFAVRALLG